MISGAPISSTPISAALVISSGGSQSLDAPTVTQTWGAPTQALAGVGSASLGTVDSVTQTWGHPTQVLLQAGTVDAATATGTWTAPTQALAGSGSGTLGTVPSVTQTWGHPTQRITGGLQWTISGTLNRGGTIGLRVDSHGYLVVVPVTAGTPGTPKNIQNLSLGCDNAGNSFLCVAEKTVGSTLGPLTPFFNLPVCNDSGGAFQVAERTAGSLDGPLTPFANIKLKTDEHGYLCICYKTAGTFGPVTNMANLRVRTDENGNLCCCYGV